MYRCGNAYSHICWKIPQNKTKRVSYISVPLEGLEQKVDSADYVAFVYTLCAGNLTSFQEWYSIAGNTKLPLSELQVTCMFRIVHCHTYCLALDHLLLSKLYDKGRQFWWASRLSHCGAIMVTGFKVKTYITK